jgi:hypothetical protein
MPACLPAGRFGEETQSGSNNGGNGEGSFHHRSRHGRTDEHIEAGPCLLNEEGAPTIGSKTDSIEEQAGTLPLSTRILARDNIPAVRQTTDCCVGMRRRKKSAPAEPFRLSAGDFKPLSVLLLLPTKRNCFHRCCWQSGLLRCKNRALLTHPLWLVVSSTSRSQSSAPYTEILCKRIS